MKAKEIFIWLMPIWSIDFITTIIALTYPNLYEGNLIPRFFFNFGVFGFIVFFILTSVIFYLFSLFIFKLSNYDKKNSELIQIIPIVVFWTLEIKTILNNVGLMI